MEMNLTVGADERLRNGHEVDVRLINDLCSSAENIIQNIRFEGLNVLHCFEGRYRIARKGYPAVFLKAGEAFMVYPGHVVTIDALDHSNRLVYGIFTGKNVVDYFNSLGCFDGLHCKTLPRQECVLKIFELMKPEHYRTASGHDACIAYLSDIVVSIVEDARESGNALVFDAIRQIRANLGKGVVRLQELCDELNVCRSYLHRVFRDAGLGGVAAFVKAEQLQRALWLLRNTDQPVAKIARASGFISTTHFSTFVRNRMGRPPRELR